MATGISYIIPGWEQRFRKYNVSFTLFSARIMYFRNTACCRQLDILSRSVHKTKSGVKMRTCSFAIVFGVATFLLNVSANADSFTYTPVAVPGLQSTYAGGIDNAGQVVVQASSNGDTQSFLYTAGSFSPIIVPGANSVNATGINDQGRIVGSYSYPTSSGYSGFLKTGNTITPINMPGALSTAPSGINDAGTIVGTYLNSASHDQGFVYANGSFTTISGPGADGLFTYVNGINNQGDVVGTYGGHGFVFSDGVLHTFNAPGDIVGSTVAQGINNLGQVVGFFQTTNPDQPIEGYLYTSGIFQDIAIPGSFATFPTGINDSGQIAGYDEGRAGNASGFIGTFTSTPEPASFALVFIALLAILGLFGFRRRATTQLRRYSRTLRQPALH
jgi:probable HAF family extracellular repeat protein